MRMHERGCTLEKAARRAYRALMGPLSGDLEAYDATQNLFVCGCVGFLF